MMSLKDKRLSKKIISSVLIIFFVVYPILQIYMNVGKVQAAGVAYNVYKRTVTVSNKGDIKCGQNEFAVLKKTQYRYQVKYQCKSPWFVTYDVAKYADNVYVHDNGVKKVTAITFTRGNVESKIQLNIAYSNYVTMDTRAIGNYNFSSLNGYISPPGVKLYGIKLQPVNFWFDKNIYVYDIYEVRYANGNSASDNYKSEIQQAQDNAKPNSTSSTSSGAPLPSSYTGGTSSGSSASGNSSIGSSSTAYQIPQSITNRTDLTDNARRLYIRNLYKRVLKREPGNSEIDGHFKNTTYKEATDIIFSPESNNINKINSMTNEQFVEACYNYLLGKTVDADGKNAWVKALANGTTRNNVILGFVTSKEFSNNTNKETTTLTFDRTTCNSIYKVLISRGYTVVKPTDTTLLMYKSDVEGLESLDLQGRGITDLTGLSSFTNLKILNLAHNKITDLTKLSSLTNLERLDLTNNQVTDLNGIEKLTKLKHLNLNHNKNVAKHQQIEKLTNLKVLWMNDCGLRYFTANLSGLTQLEEIHLDDNVIVGDGIMTLATGKNLKKIYIKNNQITTVAPLQYLKNVEEFYIDKNCISDIGFTTNTNITSATNNISLITTKNGEINLPTLIKNAKDTNSSLYTDKDLVLTNCKIEDDKILITGDNTEASVKIVGGKADGSIVNITNDAAVLTFKDKVLAQRVNRQLAYSRLEEKDGVYNIFAFKSVVDKTKYLNLSTPDDETEKIKDISGLEQFPNLNSVNLSNNSITWMSETLGKMNSLETLELRECGLKELSELRTAKSLKQLDVSHNEITVITYLSQLENLEHLLLNDNRVGNNLKALNGLSNLMVLDISNNNITSLDEISSLKLNALYANYNKISDISVIDRSGMEDLSLNNNLIDIETDKKTIEIPNIIDTDVENIELHNCKINNNNITIDDGAKRARIVVKDGIAKDTIINIINKQAIVGPEVNVSYELLKDGEYVKAIITADREIYVPGWNYEESSDGKQELNKVSRVFWYNISNQKVIVKDLYNNKTEVTLNYNGVICEHVPDLTVTYSELNTSNNSITVTLTSSEDLFENTEDGWSYGENHKTLVKTYNENNVLKFESVWTQANAGIPEKGYRLELSINNIDKVAPVCEVEYDVLGKTKSSVNAIIWADEAIELKEPRDAKVVTKIDDEGETVYGLELNYAENVDEDVIVKDIAGNESTVNIKITNIDNGVDGLTSEMDTNTAISDSVKLNLQANEEINVQKTISELASSFNKSNGLVFKIAADNLNNVAASNSNATELKIDEPMLDVVKVKDIAANDELLLVNSNMIDKEPTFYSIEHVKNDDGSVTVKITFDEPIQITDELSGWTINEESTVLTKTFTRNGTEYMEVKDLADNTTKFNVVVNDIGNINFSIIYEEIEGTDQMLVVISADRELEELEGWKLSEDKKMLGRVMGKDDECVITFYTTDGIENEVTIKANFENDVNTSDDSQADKPIPNAGLRRAVVVGIVIVLSIGALRIFKKKKYRY